MALSDTARRVLSEAAQHPMRLAAPPDKLPVAACRAVLNNLLKQGYVGECTVPMEYIGLGWRKQDGAWTAVRATEAGLAAIGAAPATTEVKEAEQDDMQAAAGIVPADTAQEPGSAPLVPPAAAEAHERPAGSEPVQAPSTRPSLRDAALRVLAAWDDEAGERSALTDAITALCAILVKPAPASHTPAPRKPREGTKQQQVLSMLRRPEGATVAQIAEATYGSEGRRTRIWRPTESRLPGCGLAGRIQAMTTVSIGRRSALGTALAMTTLACPAIGQGRFPSRPVRFLIPWAPGGTLDGFIRLQAELFQQDTGQTLVIENRPGARGTLAAQFLLTQARPDGYTIAHHHLSVIRHPFLTRRPTWDPVNDFTYIMQQTGFVFGHVVHPASGWNTLADMFAEARRRPGELTYGTSGIATSNHLAMEELCEREGVQMTHVPYRGTSENITAVLARQLDCIANSNSWAPVVESGRLRLLAVWTRERLRSFPKAPTLLELGYGMVVTSPYGIAGPKGMDPEVVETLHQAFRKTQLHPRVQEFMATNDMPDEYLGPADYTAFARERAEYERRMVTRLNLSID